MEGFKVLFRNEGFLPLKDAYVDKFYFKENKNVSCLDFVDVVNLSRCNRYLYNNLNNFYSNKLHWMFDFEFEKKSKNYIELFYQFSNNIGKVINRKIPKEIIELIDVNIN